MWSTQSKLPVTTWKRSCISFLTAQTEKNILSHAGPALWEISQLWQNFMCTPQIPWQLFHMTWRQVELKDRWAKIMIFSFISFLMASVAILFFFPARFSYSTHVSWQRRQWQQCEKKKKKSFSFFSPGALLSNDQVQRLCFQRLLIGHDVMTPVLILH